MENENGQSRTVAKVDCGENDAAGAGFFGACSLRLSSAFRWWAPPPSDLYSGQHVPEDEVPERCLDNNGGFALKITNDAVVTSQPANETTTAPTSAAANAGSCSLGGDDNADKDKDTQVQARWNAFCRVMINKRKTHVIASDSNDAPTLTVSESRE